jgi:hypothetical protein
MPEGATSIARLREAERRIARVESHPAFSDWLKDTLRTAVGRDLVDVLNDLEILGHLLRAWAGASIDLQRGAPGRIALEE